MAATETPTDRMEASTAPLLQSRLVADYEQQTAVQPQRDAHHALSIPGYGHRLAMAESGIRNPRQTQRDVWRARCGDNPHAGFGSAARGNPPAGTPAGRPGPTSPRTELAGATRPLRRRQGRRDPDTATRGRGTAPHEHPAETDLARPRHAQRTEQTAARPA